MKGFHRFLLAVISVMVISTIVLIRPITTYAWGDNGGGRESVSVQYINEHASDYGNTPFFNSITIADSDYDWYKKTTGEELAKSNLRHEKNFVAARKCIQRADGSLEGNPKDNLWYGNNINAEDGKTYLVRIYAHNNNPNGENAVAENTRVSFTDANMVASTLSDVLDNSGNPTGEKKQQVEVQGVISSSNANPTEYWDHVDFNADVPFHLEYVYGSALLEYNGFASREVNENNKDVPGAGTGPVQLSDNIINSDGSGVLIGYYGLDGRVPGCYQYANYVTIKVKVVYDYDFTVEKKVRLAGEKEWKESVDAKVGDKVEFQIKYTNTSDKQQDNVVIKDILPSNLRYVEGSTKIKDENYPNGDTLDHDYLVTDGQKVGNYGPGANVRIMFTAEVVDDNLACGKNTLVNWAQAGVGSTTLQSYSTVEVSKDGIFIYISLILLLLIILCFVGIIFLLIKMHKRKNDHSFQ